MPKVVVAYSGGLDTTICVHWLKNVKGYKVYTFSANVGQLDSLEPLAERAIELGVSAAHIADLRDKFANEYIAPCIRANAKYEHGYFLFSALSRPLIVEELVKIAQDEGCEIIAHGSRGIGNDKIRIENCLKVIAPQMEVIAPLVELKLRSSVGDLEYAKSHNIKVDSVKETVLNIERNLWGSNIQIRDLTAEQLKELQRKNTHYLTTSLEESPNKVTTIEIVFEKGMPVSLDGESISLHKLIDKLNRIAGRNAIGRFDVWETRISGVKTREIYESPAAYVIYTAHKALETITLDKDTLHFLDSLSQKYSELIYNGCWFNPLRVALDKFFSGIQEKISGGVKLNLYKGNVTVADIKV